MTSQRFQTAEDAVAHLELRNDGTGNGISSHRKLEEGHKLIDSRRMITPFTFIPPDHDQEMWFAKLDSNKIWDMVFTYVSDITDVTSAYFSCEMFRKHLEEKRRMMLLPKVFQLLQDKGLKYSGSHKYRDEKNDDSREILKLRLVSKPWKKTAEEVFLLPEYLKNLHPIWHNYCHIWSPFACRFGSSEDVDKALEKLRNTNSCAPLIRVVEVIMWKCDSEEEKNIFHSRVMEFVDLHGQAVWDLHFEEISSDIHKLYLNYDRLRELVLKMPQLKALHFKDSQVGVYDDADRAKVEESKAQVQATRQEKPFPLLPLLQFCSLDCDLSQNEVLLSEMLSKSANLKGLKSNFSEGLEDRVPLSIWNALQDLRLEYFDVIYESDLDQSDFTQDFAELGLQQWPLKFLRLGYGFPCEDTYWDNHDQRPQYVFPDASNFFTVLNQFNDSLESFELSTDRLRLFPKGRSANLSVLVDLPKLKHFICEFGDSSSSGESGDSDRESESD